MKKILSFFVILLLVLSSVNISFGADSCSYQEIENANSPIFSPDGKNFAYILLKNSWSKTAVINGIEGKIYTDIYFSSNSLTNNNYEYIALKNNGKFVIVKDGVESKEYKNIQFYGKANQFVYILEKENGNKIILKDGIEGKEYKEILFRGYYRDGKSFSYVALKDNGKQVLVKDGVEGKEYKYIGGFLYSSDGKSFSYAALKDNGKSVIVRDGVESKEYNKITGGTINGKDFIYSIEKDNGKQIVIKDGVEGKEYKYILPFLKYSIKYLYIALNDNGKYVIVRDGVESKEYKQINDFMETINGDLFYIATKDNGKQVLVKDGVEGTEYKYISKIHYLDGKKIFYIATKNNGKQVLVKDGVESKEYKQIKEYPIKISKDGKLISYIVIKDNGKQVLVKDGVEGTEYNYIRNIIYSLEGKDFVFIINNNDNSGMNVVKNGIEGKEYKNIDIYSLRISKDGKNIFYIATKYNGQKILVKNLRESIEYKDIGQLPYNIETGMISYLVTKYNGKKYLIKESCDLNNSGNNVSIEELSSKIEKVKEILKNTDYSFKVNLGSGTEGSTYHIFYKNNMVGYIYALNSGISMGSGWQGNGEVGEFYDKTNITVGEILRFFYKYNAKNINQVEVKNNNISTKSSLNIQKSKPQLFKQLILSKNKLKKSFKGRKNISTIDLIVKKLPKVKLEILMGKLKKIDTNLVKFRKYKNMLDYLEAKAGLELLK